MDAWPPITKSNRLPECHCLLLDLDTMPADLDLSALPELLKGILLHTIKYLYSVTAGNARDVKQFRFLVKIKI